MSLTRNATGKSKPRGMWMPQLPKPEYYVLHDLTKALGAEQGEVFAVLLRLGCYALRIPEGQKRIREILATYRVQLPCESNLPPILP